MICLNQKTMINKEKQGFYMLESKIGFIFT